MAAALPAIKYLEPGPVSKPAYLSYFEKYNAEAEKLSRLCLSLDAIGRLGALASTNKESRETYARVSTTADSARTVVSISRSFGMLVKVLTGGLIYEYREEPVMVENRDKDEGQPELVKKTTTDANGRVQEHYETRRGVRDWLDIVIDVFLAVARFLHPLLWLHKLGVIDLGKHAKPMGTVLGVSFSVVTTAWFLQTIRNLNTAIESNETLQTVRKKWAELISAIIDMLAIPFECGFSFAASAEMALVSACCGLASGLFWLGQELLI